MKGNNPMSHENSFVLGSPVVYRGQDFFGRETELVVSPLEKGIPGFWYWDSLSSKEFSGITPEIVRVKNRRIQLFDQTSLLQVYEHIGVLRFFGLFGLEGLGITGSGWPPYDGRAIGLWKAIKPNCLPVRKSFPLYMVRKSVSFVYDSPRGGRKAFTKISPTLNGQLTLDITRSYPGIGTQQKPNCSKRFARPRPWAGLHFCSVYRNGYLQSLSGHIINRSCGLKNGVKRNC
jgi:hypothetical protein